MIRSLIAVGMALGLAAGTAAAADSVSDDYLPATPRVRPAPTWTVAHGDHLWSIAEEHLAAVLGRTPSIEEVSTYWRNLVAANLAEIRSGNADLIYPGEVVALP